jgi:hypothetical protein
LGFAGQIKSLRGPHLARGPYVVHAWAYRIICSFFCEAYQREAEFFNLLLLDGSAIGGEPFWDDEKNFTRFVVQRIAGEKNTTPE